MTLDEASNLIIKLAIKIHNKLGPGLLESVYQRILAYELRKAGLQVQTEVPIPVKWDNHTIEDSFRADLIVESGILIELKSVEQLLPVHHKQVFTYLKLTNLNLALLINFNTPLLKDGLHRIVRNFPDNQTPPTLNQ